MEGDWFRRNLVGKGGPCKGKKKFNERWGTNYVLTKLGGPWG